MTETASTAPEPEASVTTRTTVMDADAELAPGVMVQRHGYDFNDLAGGVDQTIIATIGQTPEGCHYFNPAVTVSCPQPTPAFFAKVRQEQARWCRIASQTFRKRERRRVKSWISHERVSNKHARYLDRATCLTGILFIDGRPVPHHEWLNWTGKAVPTLTLPAVEQRPRHLAGKGHREAISLSGSER